MSNWAGGTRRRRWARCTEKPGRALSSEVAARTKRDCTSTGTCGWYWGSPGNARWGLEGWTGSDGQPANTRRQGACYARRDPSRELPRHVGEDVSTRPPSMLSHKDSGRRSSTRRFEIGARRPQFCNQQLGGTDACFENKDGGRAGGPWLGRARRGRRRHSRCKSPGS